MGCVLVYRMIIKDSDRDFYGSWLPTGRVLKKIDETLDRNSESFKCFLKCNEMFDSDVDYMMENASINFSDSDTKGQTKNYELNVELEDGRNVFAMIKLKGEESTLTDMSVDGKECSCD